MVAAPGDTHRHSSCVLHIAANVRLYQLQYCARFLATYVLILVLASFMVEDALQQVIESVSSKAWARPW